MLLLVVLLLVGVSSICFEGTSILGLKADMSIVPGTPTTCSNQTDCLEKFCKINNVPSVSWIAVRATA